VHSHPFHKCILARSENYKINTSSLSIVFLYLWTTSVLMFSFRVYKNTNGGSAKPNIIKHETRNLRVKTGRGKRPSHYHWRPKACNYVLKSRAPGHLPYALSLARTHRVYYTAHTGWVEWVNVCVRSMGVFGVLIRVWFIAFKSCTQSLRHLGHLHIQITRSAAL
jgi:hypothetical protein